MFICLIQNLQRCKYSNETLIVILDRYNKPWFNASHIGKILKYKKPQNVIRQLVEKNILII